ncbi:MAG: PP2C family protein-serine/threonine phosphatase, partial [Blastocatellia bacterium]
PMNRRLLQLLPPALIGYVLLFTLFPRTSPAARWNHQLDRAAAIAKAREAAAKAGLDTSNWNVLVKAGNERFLERYLTQEKSPIFASHLTTVTTTVRFTDLRTGRRFRAELNSRGELTGFRETAPAKGSSKDDAAAAPKPTEAELSRDRQIAEQSLDQTLSDVRRVFTSPPTTSFDKNGNRFSWTASDERIKLVAEVQVRNSKATELKTEANPTQKFQSEIDASPSTAYKFLDNAENLIFWPSLIAIFILYFIGLARRQVNHRRTLTFLLVTLVLLMIVNGFGNFYDDVRSEININTPRYIYWLETLFPPVIFGLLMLVFAASAYLYYASGTALTGRLPQRRTIDLELALKGKLLTRPVVASLAAGLMASGILAAFPYVVTATGLFPASSLGTRNLVELFVSRIPLAASLLGGMQFSCVLVFAFSAQVVDAWVRPGLRAWALTFLLAVLGFGGVTPFRASFGAALLTALATAFLLTWIYYRFGLLATFVTTIIAQIATGAMALLAQPSASLNASGWRFLATLGGLALAGLAGLAKSREATESEIAPDVFEMDTRVERERLQAEFDVARRAQQHMLPDEPPRVPGLNIAAVCLPSREVGGDLYDFLPLRDGKLGIVVADVSGKGVPASLYMTLTKGLLDSISEERTDPGEILREVNRHLYDVCRRKMFVTLFLGVIDPATRTLTYARAGHNPTIFRSPAEQKTELLKSRGMGLGLNRGKLFDQSLTVETLRLQQRDKLFFYSDGITEAMNVRNEEYGEVRLMALAEKADPMNADEARDTVLADVRAFLGENTPQDDQTLVVVEVV